MNENLLVHHHAFEYEYRFTEYEYEKMREPSTSRKKMGTGMIPVPRGDASTSTRKEGERGEGEGIDEWSRGDSTPFQLIAAKATIVHALSRPSRSTALTNHFVKYFVRWTFVTLATRMTCCLRIELL